MGDRTAKSELFEQFARVAKALAAPRRLELLDLLAQGERSVDGLARAAGIGISTASMHLQSLRQAGLVRTRREGTSVHYRLAGDVVAGQPVMHARTFLASAHKARLPQRLQMHRCCRHPDPGGPCESVDTALSLCQQIEQLEPPRGSQRLRDPRELLEQLALGGAITHHKFQSSLEYCSNPTFKTSTVPHARPVHIRCVIG